MNGMGKDSQEGNQDEQDDKGCQDMDLIFKMVQP
jgi:hypothetical protein